jgi:uncharacterized damage-inducible protein DinB
MNLKNHLQILSQYHYWAMDHLYVHLNGVSEEDYRKDSGLFFKSIHRTLNHLLVVDLLWFSRFVESRSPVVALDMEVEPNREKLRERLEEQTRKWEIIIKNPKPFPELLEYSTMRGFQTKIPFSTALAHVFNHGTHHRGQIIAAMTTGGYSSPEIDLVYMLQSLPIAEYDE